MGDMIEIEAGDPITKIEGFVEWLDSHEGIEADSTYRIEIEGERLTAYQFAVAGGVILKTVGGQPMEQPPVTVTLRHPMPARVIA